MTASLLHWELLQQVDNGPIPRLWRRLTDSCSFSSYFERSQEALPKAARCWRADGGRWHHFWWQTDTAQECREMPTCLPAPWRLLTRHQGAKNITGEAERCVSFPEHKPQHLGARDQRPSPESSPCQPAMLPAAMPGSSWRAVNELPYLSTLH